MSIREKISAFFVWVFSPVALVWNESLALRGEHIRSLCVIVMLCVLVFALGRIDDPTPPWMNGHWILGVIAMVTIALIAWNAQSAKVKVAKFQASFSTHGQAPELATDGLFAETSDNPKNERFTPISNAVDGPEDYYSQYSDEPISNAVDNPDDGEE